MDQISKKSKIFNLLSVIAILSSSKFSPRITKENKTSNPAVEQPGYLVITETKVKCYMEMHKKTSKQQQQKKPTTYFCYSNPFGFILLRLQSTNSLEETFLQMQFHIRAHLLCMTCPLHPLPSASRPLLWFPIMTHFFPFHPNCRNSPWAGVTACMTLYPVMLWFWRRRQYDPFSPGENKSVSFCLQLSSTVFLKHYKRGRGKQLKLFNVNYEIGHQHFSPKAPWT